MSFSINDLETIKSKIQLSSEIEKKTKLIKKGNDYWCCCPFHEEKTPSCKINNDLGSYYCFGCGAKGDIFTIYTQLYNYTFPDAVKELAQRVGITISQDSFKQNKEKEITFKILDLSAIWFEKNLEQNSICKDYLKKRLISSDTIKKFRLGYSNNPNSSLYQFLKDALIPESSPSNIIVGLLPYFQDRLSWFSVKAVPSGATAVLILFS